jgi:hypothetical protein
VQACSAFHFVSCRTSVCDFLRVSATHPPCNPQPVNNPLFPVEKSVSPNKDAPQKTYRL